MKQNTLIKKFGVLCLTGFLTITPQIFAETDTKTNTNAQNENKGLISKEQKIKKIKEFKELIIQKDQRPVNSTQRTPSHQSKVEPIVVLVKSIVGEEENDRYAIIEFEGKELTVRKDQIVEKKFKVIDIYPDRMVVYSPREQRRHTYKLIKDEK